MLPLLLSFFFLFLSPPKSLSFFSYVLDGLDNLSVNMLLQSVLMGEPFETLGKLEHQSLLVERFQILLQLPFHFFQVHLQLRILSERARRISNVLHDLVFRAVW